MKTKLPILALLAGLGVFVWSGCATPTKKSGATPSASAAQSEETTIEDDSLAGDLPGKGGLSAPKGNPDALAHFAAGISYEWNDDDRKAVQQFDDAALADPSNEQLVIKVAQRYLKNKQMDKAVAVLENSAHRRDASAQLLSWLSRADLEAGKTNKALTVSRRSIARDPAAFDGYESEIGILFRKNDLVEAGRVLHKAAKAVRPDPRAYLSIAALYSIYLKGMPKDLMARTEAIALLDRVGKMDLNSSRLWQTLADTYTGFGQPQKAAAIYNKLLAEAPEPSVLRDTLHEKLAGIYFQAEDKTNATKQLEAIVRDNPTRYPRAWFYLGELAFADDNLIDAANDYDNAIHWDPNLEEAWYKLALVQIELHRSTDAFKTLDAARARFPKTFLCEYYTGIAFLHLKKYGDAIHHFDEAEMIGLSASVKELDYRFYFQYGEACERNQDYKKADEFLQKCINLNPNFGEALNYLGYMLADRGEQLPRARLLIEKAIRLEPKNGAYLDSLGWVFFKLKQPQQALTWLLKANDVSPEPDATMLDHLGEVYMALHQPGKAIDAWKKSLSIESNPDVKKKLDAFTGGA